MVNAEGKINFDEIFASLFVINVSILMYKKPPEIQYNTTVLDWLRQEELQEVPLKNGYFQTDIWI